MINNCPIFHEDFCRCGELCKYFYIDIDRHSFCRHKEMQCFRKLAEHGQKITISK